MEKASEIFHVVGVAADMLPEPVPLDQEVLGVVGDALLGGKLMDGMIVLEDVTSHSGMAMGGNGESVGDLKKKVTKRDES